MEEKYNMSFEESQEYIAKSGLDILWNDGDIFIDEREITRTIGNVLKYANERMIERVCNWLRCNLEKHYYLDEAYDKVIGVKNVIEGIKKEMLS